LYKLIDNVGIDFIEDLLTPLDNLVSRGTETFLNGPYLEMTFNMYKKCLVDEEVSEAHRIDGTKLAEVVLLNCKGRIDNYVEPFIELAILRMPGSQRTDLKVTLMGVVANALYYNPILAMHILEKRGWTKEVFNAWLLLVPKLSRTHEKKLSILALSSLLSIPLQSLPAVIQLGMKQIVETIINLQKSLDDQKTRIEEESKQQKLENSEEEDLVDDLPDDDEVQDDETFTNLVRTAAKYAPVDADDDDDDEEEGNDDLDFDEDGLDDYFDSDEELDAEFISPVDFVDEMIYFVDYMKALANSDNANYQKLWEQLDQNHRVLFQELVVQAEVRRAELIRVEQEKQQH